MKKLLFVFFASLILFTSCGDDDDGAVISLPILGTWKAQTGDFYDAENIILTDDNKLRIFSEDSGFREVLNISLETLTPEQFSFSGGGLVEVDYVVSGDELQLTVGSSTSTFTRDNAFAPSSWAIEVSATGGFQLPTGAEGSDPGFSEAENVFYYADGYGTDQFYKINTDGSIASSAPISFSSLSADPFSVGPVVSNGGSEYIILIDPTTGAEVDRSSNMGAWIKGIAWDGANTIYCVSNNEQKVYAFNTNTLANSETGNISFGPTGMHYRNDHLYITSFNMIYKVRISDFRVIDTYVFDTSSGGALSGITHDGNTFWVATEIFENEEWRIYFRPITLN